MSDLLGLNTESWNPSSDFPTDVTVDGFDNELAELGAGTAEKYFPADEGAIQWLRNLKVDQRVKVSTKLFELVDKIGIDYYCFQVDRYRFKPGTPTPICTVASIGGHLGFLPLNRTGGVPHSGS